MRILGIDPGSNVTGWGVITVAGKEIHHLDDGCIRTPSGTPLPQRLDHIFSALNGIIDSLKPDACAIEDIFVSHNVKSALKLGHARGVAMVAASGKGLPVTEYTALQVKKAVVGYGRADKNQVQEMVKMLLNLHRRTAQDASDALAVALCHAHSRPQDASRAAIFSQIEAQKAPDGTGMPGMPNTTTQMHDKGSQAVKARAGAIAGIRPAGTGSTGARSDAKHSVSKGPRIGAIRGVRA